MVDLFDDALPEDLEGPVADPLTLSGLSGAVLTDLFEPGDLVELSKEIIGTEIRLAHPDVSGDEEWFKILQEAEESLDELDAGELIGMFRASHREIEGVRDLAKSFRSKRREHSKGRRNLVKELVSSSKERHRLDSPVRIKMTDPRILERELLKLESQIPAKVEAIAVVKLWEDRRKLISPLIEIVAYTIAVEKWRRDYPEHFEQYVMSESNRRVCDAFVEDHRGDGDEKDIHALLSEENLRFEALYNRLSMAEPDTLANALMTGRKGLISGFNLVGFFDEETDFDRELYLHAVEFDRSVWGLSQWRERVEEAIGDQLAHYSEEITEEELVAARYRLLTWRMYNVNLQAWLGDLRNLFGEEIEQYKPELSELRFSQDKVADMIRETLTDLKLEEKWHKVDLDPDQIETIRERCKAELREECIGLLERGELSAPFEIVVDRSGEIISGTGIGEKLGIGATVFGYGKERSRRIYRDKATKQAIRESALRPVEQDAEIVFGLPKESEGGARAKFINFVASSELGVFFREVLDLGLPPTRILKFREVGDTVELVIAKEIIGEDGEHRVVFGLLGEVEEIEPLPDQVES